MRGYLALIRITLKLAIREKAVLFFNFVFPLIFFFGFGQAFGAQSGAITRVVTMVLVIGMLGSGLFGAGIRAVAEREANILRRYKVAPITAAPLLVASMVTGWLLYMPAVLMVLGLAHFYYHMPFPDRWFSLLVLVTLGTLALRALGLIIASVVNSVAESNILIQLMYMPMLFLSGATFPITELPIWAQIVSQFLPASYLYAGVQGIVLRHESIGQNAVSALALIVAMLVAMLISVKLFRWEKEETIARSAKLWILAVFVPFILIGGYQAYSRENIAKNRMYERDFRRSHTRLIRGVRIFTGDGRVIDSGAVLIKHGKIAEVYENGGPDPKSLDADPVEAFGKTLLPGLIDVHVHLGAGGGIPENVSEFDPKKQIDRSLAAYLFSGVTAVKSVGDLLDASLAARSRIASGDRLGAELFACGPLFTTEGGHGTEYFKDAPVLIQKMSAEQFLRTPKTPQEAQSQVDELKAKGMDGIKAILEGGAGSIIFNRLDIAVLQAIAHRAKADGLPMVTHTGDARDVADAAAAGTNGIEHGSARDRIPDATFAALKAGGIAYDPTLSVVEAFPQFCEGKTDLLDRSLVAQAVPPKLIQSTKAFMHSPKLAGPCGKMKGYPVDLRIAQDNLLRAWKAGVLLVTGSDAGNMLVMHGPTVHREMQLWVAAGIPAPVALQAATYNGAKLLRADKRMGLIRKGYEANLLLVDGNPLQDISITERISSVFFRGERIDRAGLLDQK
jgi:imidazolonepropionase-like amidohydrolase/ABC-type multidrug transport system permease subunit